MRPSVEIGTLTCKPYVEKFSNMVFNLYHLNVFTLPPEQVRDTTFEYTVRFEGTKVNAQRIKSAFEVFDYLMR